MQQADDRGEESQLICLPEPDEGSRQINWLSRLPIFLMSYSALVYISRLGCPAEHPEQLDLS